MVSASLRLRGFPTFLCSCAAGPSSPTSCRRSNNTGMHMGSVKFPLLLAMTAAITLASIAHAETYKWVDAQGHIQYTDRLPTEAVSRGNVQMSKQGIAKNVTEAPLTAEQRRAIEERL